MLFRFLLILLVFAIHTADGYGQFPNPAAEASRRLSVIQGKVMPIYREPNSKELKSVAVDEAIISTYKEFLTQPRTGIAKLIPDQGCSESTKIISASGHCLEYSMPGGGSSFSFRTKTYRIPRLSDITCGGRGFQASGVLLLGIFVRLGDISLDKVSLQTAGLRYLIDFEAPPQFEDAKKISGKLVNGISSGGFLYRRGLYSTPNTTYALRTIAYGGKHWRAIDGVTYNELDFDKRKDLIVIFRVVDEDTAGNATILWKVLDEKKSPVIRRDEPNNGTR